MSVVPVGREFPDRADTSGLDWLVVEVNVTRPGATWRARDACLTTSAAPMITDWLRLAAAGSVPVTVPGPDGDITPDLTFLEPALAFSLAPSESELKHLRAHLTYELAPPWLSPDEKCNMWQFFVEVPMTNADILVAADVWEAELMGLPGHRR